MPPRHQLDRQRRRGGSRHLSVYYQCQSCGGGLNEGATGERGCYLSLYDPVVVSVDRESRAGWYFYPRRQRQHEVSSSLLDPE